MPKIKVISPFGLRLDSKSKLRTFAPGLHDVSEQELAHWHLQACLKQGKAVRLDAAGPAPVGGSSSTPTGAAPADLLSPSVGLEDSPTAAVALLSPSVGLEDSPTAAVPTVEYTEKALSKLTNVRLAEVGAGLGLSFDKPIKAEMVAAILRAQRPEGLVPVDAASDLRASTATLQGGSPNPDESEQNTENTEQNTENPEQEPEKQPENTEGAE